MTGVRIVGACLLAAVTAAAQVILVTDPAGEGGASNPIVLFAPNTAPGQGTISRTVTLGAAASTGGTFFRQAQSGAWLNVTWEQITPTTANVFLTADPTRAQLGVNEGLVIMAYQTPTALNTITIYVQFIVGSTGPPAPLSTTPRVLSFTGVPYSQSMAAQGVAVTSSNTTPVSFTVTTTTNNGVNWLGTTTPGTVLTTPATVIVTVSPQNLAPNQQPYIGTITVTPVNGGVPSAITVRYDVGVDLTPQVQLSTRALHFQHQLNTATPPPRAVAVSATPPGVSPLLYNVQFSTTTGGSWLQVESPGTTTPGTFLVSLSPAVVNGLPAGNYLGRILVSAGGAENSPLDIPVTLSVTATPQVRLSSNTAVVFNAATNVATAPVQTLTVGSTGTDPLPIQVSTQGASWLTASLSQNTTPATLNISANAAGYSVDGSFSGTVTVTSGSSSVTIPVTLNLTSQNQINVDRNEINFVSGLNTTQALTVESPGTGAGYSVQTIVSSPAGGNWLQVSQTAGTTPSTIQVRAVQGSLAAGVYYGVLAFTAVAAPTVYVPVTFRVAAPITVSPTALTFVLQQGQALPAGQTLTIGSTVATPISISYQGPSTARVLDVTLAGSATNTTALVRPNSAAAALAPGTYRWTILITPAGSFSSLEVPVTLVVSPAIQLSASPSTLNFRSSERATQNPPPQTLSITGSAGAAQAFTVAVATDAGGNWLSATPSNGQTPATITVQASAGSLLAGSYTGSVTITAIGVAGTPSAVRIPVSLTVDRVLAPNVTEVVNGASFQAGPISPGLVASLTGTNLGPEGGVNAQVAGGRLVRTLGGVRVLLDGNEAPLLFVRNDQINFLVPYALAGRPQVLVQVEKEGVLSNQLMVGLRATSPAIFNLGNGQAAALNQNGSINGAGNPAERGSVVVLYMTGEGVLTPPGVDGEITTGIKRPVAPVVVRVGGVEVANIAFAGAAPGLAQGILQVNFVVPETISPGPAVPLTVTIGGVDSPSGITLAVR